TEILRMRWADQQRRNDARNQKAALVSLVTSQSIGEGNFEAASRLATELLAQTVEVERASVWLLDDSRQRMKLVDLYSLADGEHHSDVTLEASDYPAYFEAMNTGRLIDAHDALTDPRTNEFADGYLRPLGISSMLDVAL